MAYSKAGMECVGVGPTKLYIYSCTETLTSALAQAKPSGFCLDNCPGMSAGDVIIVCHNTNALMEIVRVTGIDATTCTLQAKLVLA